MESPWDKLCPVIIYIMAAINSGSVSGLPCILLLEFNKQKQVGHVTET